MTRLRIASVLLLASTAAADTDDLERRAAAIRPSPAESRWREIPWLGSMVEAREAAEKEDRPVFIWGADDDPFERC